MEKHKYLRFYHDMNNELFGSYSYLVHAKFLGNSTMHIFIFHQYIHDYNLSLFKY